VKISIITACYNSSAAIETAVRSVLDQTHSPVEYIVVDGASTDGTLDILAGYKGRISRLISEKDGGIYYALNKGFSAATGDVVGLLHSDDVYAGADVLEKVARVFAETGADAVYGDLAYVRADGSVLRYWKAGVYDRASLERGWMPPHPAFFARREVYAKYGLFDTSYRIAADYELLTRLLYKNSLKTAYIPELLVKMRVGGTSNRSLKNILLKSREDYRVINTYGLGGIKTLLMKNFSKLPQFFRRAAAPR